MAGKQFTHHAFYVTDDDAGVDLHNYKGIYANDDNSQKYQCPVTGAHFEYNDLCKRIVKLMEKRKIIDEQIYQQEMKQK